MIRFEQDEKKNETNIKKHGISFEKASSVFQDEESLIISDENHSQKEDRFILIGFSFKANLLVVCHCYREKDSIIRIISARKADRNERKQYLENL